MSINTLIYNSTILDELKVAIPNSGGTSNASVVFFSQGQTAVNTNVQQYNLIDAPAPNIVANKNLLLFVAYSCQSSLDGQVIQIAVAFNGQAQQTFYYNISSQPYTNNISVQFYLQSPVSAPQLQITVNTFDGADTLSTSGDDFYNVSIVQF